MRMIYVFRDTILEIGKRGFVTADDVKRLQKLFLVQVSKRKKKLVKLHLTIMELV